MKSLVSYYSRTNTTKKLAQRIAEKTDADIEEIRSKVNYNGKIGFARGGKDALQAKIIGLEDLKHDPADYDIVYLGCPVWAGKAANPLISYIKQNEGKFSNVKFFATAASDDFVKVFQQLEEYAGKPQKTLGLKTKDVKKDLFEDELDSFIQ